MAAKEKAIAREIAAKNNVHNDKIFNDDDDFKVQRLSPEMVAQYDDFSEDGDEIAFGTLY